MNDVIYVYHLLNSIVINSSLLFRIGLEKLLSGTVFARLLDENSLKGTGVLPLFSCPLDCIGNKQLQIGNNTMVFYPLETTADKVIM